MYHKEGVKIQGNHAKIVHKLFEHEKTTSTLDSIFRNWKVEESATFIAQCNNWKSTLFSKSTEDANPQMTHRCLADLIVSGAQANNDADIGKHMETVDVMLEFLARIHMAMGYPGPDHLQPIYQEKSYTYDNYVDEKTGELVLGVRSKLGVVLGKNEHYSKEFVLCKDSGTRIGLEKLPRTTPTENTNKALTLANAEHHGHAPSMISLLPKLLSHDCFYSVDFAQQEKLAGVSFETKTRGRQSIGNDLATGAKIIASKFDPVKKYTGAMAIFLAWSGSTPIEIGPTEEFFTMEPGQERMYGFVPKSVALYEAKSSTLSKGAKDFFPVDLITGDPVHFLEIGSGYGLMALLVRLFFLRKGECLSIDAKPMPVLVSRAVSSAVFGALNKSYEKMKWTTSNPDLVNSLKNCDGTDNNVQYENAQSEKDALRKILDDLHVRVEHNLQALDGAFDIATTPALMEIRKCIGLLENAESLFHLNKEELAGTEASRELLLKSLDNAIMAATTAAKSNSIEEFKKNLVNFDYALLQEHNTSPSRLYPSIVSGFNTPQQHLNDLYPLDATDVNPIPSMSTLDVKYEKVTHVFYDASLASFDENARTLRELLLGVNIFNQKLYPNVRSLCTTISPKEMHTLGLLAPSTLNDASKEEADKHSGLVYLGRTTIPIEQRWNFFTGKISSTNNRVPVEKIFLKTSENPMDSTIARYYHFYGRLNQLPPTSVIAMPSLNASNDEALILKKTEYYTTKHEIYSNQFVDIYSYPDLFPRRSPFTGEINEVKIATTLLPQLEWSFLRLNPDTMRESSIREPLKKYEPPVKKNEQTLSYAKMVDLHVGHALCYSSDMSKTTMSVVTLKIHDDKNNNKRLKSGANDNYGDDNVLKKRAKKLTTTATAGKRPRTNEPTIQSGKKPRSEALEKEKIELQSVNKKSNNNIDKESFTWEIVQCLDADADSEKKKKKKKSLFQPKKMHDSIDYKANYTLVKKPIIIKSGDEDSGDDDTPMKKAPNVKIIESFPKLELDNLDYVSSDEDDEENQLDIMGKFNNNDNPMEDEYIPNEPDSASSDDDIDNDDDNDDDNDGNNDDDGDSNDDADDNNDDIPTTVTTTTTTTTTTTNITNNTENQNPNIADIDYIIIPSDDDPIDYMEISSDDDVDNDNNDGVDTKTRPATVKRKTSSGEKSVDNELAIREETSRKRQRLYRLDTEKSPEKKTITSELYNKLSPDYQTSIGRAPIIMLNRKKKTATLVIPMNQVAEEKAQLYDDDWSNNEDDDDHNDNNDDDDDDIENETNQLLLQQHQHRESPIIFPTHNQNNGEEAIDDIFSENSINSRSTTPTERILSSEIEKLNNEIAMDKMLGQSKLKLLPTISELFEKGETNLINNDVERKIGNLLEDVKKVMHAILFDPNAFPATQLDLSDVDNSPCVKTQKTQNFSETADNRMFVGRSHLQANLPGKILRDGDLEFVVDAEHRTPISLGNNHRGFDKEMGWFSTSIDPKGASRDAVMANFLPFGNANIADHEGKKIVSSNLNGKAPAIREFYEEGENDQSPFSRWVYIPRVQLQNDSDRRNWKRLIFWRMLVANRSHWLHYRLLQALQERSALFSRYFLEHVISNGIEKQHDIKKLMKNVVFLQNAPVKPPTVSTEKHGAVMLKNVHIAEGDFFIRENWIIKHQDALDGSVDESLRKSPILDDASLSDEDGENYVALGRRLPPHFLLNNETRGRRAVHAVDSSFSERVHNTIVGPFPAAIGNTAWENWIGTPNPSDEGFFQEVFRTKHQLEGIPGISVPPKYGSTFLESARKRLVETNALHPPKSANPKTAKDSMVSSSFNPTTRQWLILEYEHDIVFGIDLGAAEVGVFGTWTNRTEYPTEPPNDGKDEAADRKLFFLLYSLNAKTAEEFPTLPYFNNWKNPNGPYVPKKLIKAQAYENQAAVFELHYKLASLQQDVFQSQWLGLEKTRPPPPKK